MSEGHAGSFADGWDNSAARPAITRRLRYENKCAGVVPSTVRNAAINALGTLITFLDPEGNECSAMKYSGVAPHA